MNFDIEYCTNKQCRLKRTCERYIFLVKDFDARYAYWTRFMPAKDKLHCQHYIRKEKVVK